MSSSRKDLEDYKLKPFDIKYSTDCHCCGTNMDLSSIKYDNHGTSLMIYKCSNKRYGLFRCFGTKSIRVHTFVKNEA